MQVGQLLEGNFAQTIEQNFVVCDVYGIKIEGAGWYVKLYLDFDGAGEDVVVCMSFHPLEKPLVTNGGTVNP